MDDDGLEIGKPVPIKVKVVVKGDEMTIDLTDISKQVRGFFNSGPSTSIGLAQMAYKCVTSPTDYPINDGSFRSLKVIAPQGTIVSATRPAPMRWWMTYPMTVVDTIYKALQPAIPDRVIAGHHADLVTSAIHGINPRTREFFIGGLGPLGGGWGAKLTEDGMSATVCANDGDTHNSPNEQSEAKFPIVVERCALIPDSGGAGRYRGGLGIETVVRARSNLVVNTQTDRAHCKPWGLDGGLEATGNQIQLRANGVWKTDQPNAKLLVTQLKPGDAYRLRSGGGGGYGSPLARNIAAVRNDVRQGYVSAEAAQNLYGVVVDAETFDIDEAATEALRASMQR
jgi:N-methylhydantoinase B